jgi:hypothetical protein
MEIRDHRVTRVSKVSRGIRVQQVLKEYREIPGHRETRVIKAIRVIREA